MSQRFTTEHTAAPHGSLPSAKIQSTIWRPVSLERFLIIFYAYIFVVGRPGEKGPVEGPPHSLKHMIESDVKDTGYEDAVWVNRPAGGDPVDLAINLRVAFKQGNLLTIWTIISFTMMLIHPIS